ncbi:hypothetical protein NPIL_32971 [Nephila pilipes]|uniref:Uncharacterized protein n=1 Tax=Nephila pilipes TaxID=299642 RepID=A0A8X6NC01_NEPPI|nr:hypothetical protein NPIL_32971 [Nephila pilipes]
MHVYPCSELRSYSSTQSERSIKNKIRAKRFRPANCRRYFHPEPLRRSKRAVCTGKHLLTTVPLRPPVRCETTQVVGHPHGTCACATGLCIPPSPPDIPSSARVERGRLFLLFFGRGLLMELYRLQTPHTDLLIYVPGWYRGRLRGPSWVEC